MDLRLLALGHPHLSFGLGHLEENRLGSDFLLTDDHRLDNDWRTAVVVQDNGRLFHNNWGMVHQNLGWRRTDDNWGLTVKINLLLFPVGRVLSNQGLLINDLLLLWLLFMSTRRRLWYIY